MTIKQQGGVFGRNPTFNDVAIGGELSVSGEVASGTNRISGDLFVNDSTPTIRLTDTDVSYFSQVRQVSGTMIIENDTANLVSNSLIVFRIDGAEAVKIDGNKNLVIANAGSGIDFSATSQASGSTSELFDDYEEGTWTPTYTTDGTDFGSVTYDTQDGHYTKIGNVVVLRAYLRTDAITVGSASGNVVVGGLPFSASNSRNAGSVIPSAFIGDHPIMIQASGSTAYLYYQASASGTTSLLQVADLNTGANDNTIVFTVTYQAS